MNRVLILGSGGAGKSSLARALRDILDLPVIHLDAAFWKPGWVETSREEWDERVKTLVLGERWIIDGNFSRSLEMRLAACDTAIFLNFSRHLCIYRVFKRWMMYSGRPRPDMSPECPEKFPDLEFLQWLWSYPRMEKPVVLKMLAAAKSAGKRVIIIKSPRELPLLLAQIKKDAAAVPFKT